MKTVYVYGNSFVEEDAMALQVGRTLKGVNIVHLTMPEQLFDLKEKKVTILDVVANITDPLIIQDISQLDAPHLVSLHDFDLGFYLLLMQKMGINKHIKIIGIPPTGDAQKIGKQVKTWI